ncbi:hypothetical protein MC885_002544 [Smutsia gigantea]|nr:hypothetical protein MC885_002544 [Smutsia gigantea]
MTSLLEAGLGDKILRGTLGSAAVPWAQASQLYYDEWHHGPGGTRRGPRGVGELEQGLHHPTRDLSQAPLLPLHDGTTAPSCPGKDSSPRAQHGFPGLRPLHRATTMVMRGDCSLYAKGWLAQSQGAHGPLIGSQVSSQQGSDTTLVSQAPGKSLPGLTIPVAVLRYGDMLDILSHTHGNAMVHVALYAPPEPVLDYNMVVIFILAVGTVAAGGYWAGLTEAERLGQRRARGGGGPGGHNQRAETAAQGGQEEEDEDAPVDLTPATTGTVVTMSSSILLLLYFFYDTFVYVMIAIFSLGAGTGLYSCLTPLVRLPPPQQCQRPLADRWACLRLPLLAGLCTVVTVLWVAYRNDDRWAWLLQDTLGVTYCLFVLQRVRLPTLENCASFLLALLASDVFFVFVTPPLTRTDESIMVEVAVGPADSLSHERLPLVLKVPQLSFSALTLCDQPCSILGFGDIVVPGFLVACCHRFDVQIHSRQVYFLACTAAYAMGLLVTFAAVALMQMGQPALLYLGSSTLLTSLAVAACRQELTLFWTGQGRAKTPTQPVAGLCADPSVGPEPKQDATDVHAASESEGATEPLSRGLRQQLWGGCARDWQLVPLMPVAMLVPRPSELGPAHTQAQAHEAGLPWTALHKRKGLKVKKGSFVK